MLKSGSAITPGLFVKEDVWQNVPGCGTAPAPQFLCFIVPFCLSTPSQEVSQEFFLRNSSVHEHLRGGK
jgi:hypothetical protein